LSASQYEALKKRRIHANAANAAFEESLTEQMEVYEDAIANGEDLNETILLEDDLTSAHEIQAGVEEKDNQNYD
jgi:hypothetical protein